MPRRALPRTGSFSDWLGISLAVDSCSVIFDLPEKQTSARGIIQADGTFRLTTNKPNDGALAGEYTVLIIEANRKPLGGADSTELAPGVIDIRYADPPTSDLRATVKPGSNQITLTVERLPRR